MLSLYNYTAATHSLTHTYTSGLKHAYTRLHRYQSCVHTVKPHNATRWLVPFGGGLANLDPRYPKWDQAICVNADSPLVVWMRACCQQTAMTRPPLSTRSHVHSSTSTDTPGNISGRSPVQRQQTRKPTHTQNTQAVSGLSPFHSCLSLGQSCHPSVLVCERLSFVLRV